MVITMNSSFFKNMILAAVAPLSGRMISSLDQLEQWLRIASLAVGLGVGLVSLTIAAIQLYRILRDKYQRRKIKINWPTLMLIGGFLVFASGCSSVPKPQKGGHIRSHVSDTNVWAEVSQPDNPAAPASQSQETVEETKLVLPPQSRVVEKTVVAPKAAGEAPTTNIVEFILSDSTPVTKTVQRRAQATVGAAQKDEGRTLGVKMDALRPVMLAGVLMLIAAGALFYFGHYLAGGISAAIGVAMLVLFVTLPQYGLWIMGAGLVGAAILIGLAFLAYYKGNHHALEDAFAKLTSINSQPTKANESLPPRP